MTNALNIPKSILLDMYVDQGLTMAEIAQQLRVHIVTIGRYLKKYGLCHQPSKQVEDSLIRKLYIDDRLTQHQVGSIVGLGDGTINRRLCMMGIPCKHRRLGRYSSNWNGGKYTDSKGYVHILAPDYWCASKDGYVSEHVMVWEKANNMHLPDGWVVHHFNGIKNDNRKENLIGMPSSEHTKLAEPYIERIRLLELRIKYLEQKQYVPAPDWF